MNHQPERAHFTAMEHGTQADWNIIGGHFGDFAKSLPGRVLTHLRLLDGDYGGFPVDRLQHSLQTATRAPRRSRRGLCRDGAAPRHRRYARHL